MVLYVTYVIVVRKKNLTQQIAPKKKDTLLSWKIEGRERLKLNAANFPHEKNLISSHENYFAL